MTIEEYEVRLQAEMAASYKAIEDIGKFDKGTVKYYKGQTDAFKIALDLLKKLEHEVTLKEVKEMCERREGCEEKSCADCLEESECKQECADCKACPLCKDGVATHCFVSDFPHDWDIPEIQKRMKEAQQ